MMDDIRTYIKLIDGTTWESHESIEVLTHEIDTTNSTSTKINGVWHTFPNTSILYMYENKVVD